MKNNAVIYGSAGQIEIPDIFWSPTVVIVNGEVRNFPLPKSAHTLNFPNSEGKTRLAIGAFVLECFLSDEKLHSLSLSWFQALFMKWKKLVDAWRRGNCKVPVCLIARLCSFIALFISRFNK